MPTLLMMSSLRVSLLATALLAACTIKQSSDADSGQDSECLELFETCVELAGESPGCTEVFQFCEGAASPAGTGGGSVPGSCEQNYIDCLSGGSSADDCQPLLDACMPSGSSTGCDPLEPGCTGAEESSVTTDEPVCEGVACDPGESDCDLNFQHCLEVVGDAGDRTCEQLRGACEAGECDYALSLCSRLGQPLQTCQELTGCYVDPSVSCDELLSACAKEGVSPSECGQLYPDSPDCFPEAPTECPWYEQECEPAGFNPSFCQDGQQACQAGWFPEVFECGLLFPDSCGMSGLSETACAQVEMSCHNGFMDALDCSITPLYKDPLTWLMELADCNGWE